MSGGVLLPNGPDGTQYLATVTNKQESIYILAITPGSTATPTVAVQITLSGFEDTEGLAYMGMNKLAIAEERRGTIAIIDLPAIPPPGSSLLRTSARYSSAEKIKTGINNGNSGLEGITYDESRSCFYAVQEKSPRKVLQVDYPSGKTAELFRGESLPTNSLSDLAGLTYLPLSGSLLILSHASSTLAEVALDGKVLSTKRVTGTQVEGITVSDDLEQLYIMSEPNEVIYYQRKTT